MAGPKVKPKAERKAAKREPEPDVMQIAWKTVEETIRRSEGRS
jgi:hypothetical protein